MKQVCRLLFALQLISVAGATGAKIIGGRVSRPHSRPYMASVQRDGQHLCGGVLIRDNFVLTAAHCSKNSPTMVVLGAHNLSRAEQSQQRIKVQKSYPHKHYKQGYDYDIMLLKLKTKAKLNKYTKTMKLPDGAPVKIDCTVAGWGKTGAEEPPSKVLKETEEVLQSSKTCKKLWQNHFYAQHMVCTKSKANEGVYQGDSGGPLLCGHKLIGITSFTSNIVTHPGYPHVFTNVPFFVPWIKSVTNSPHSSD
ncbi:mast cell protease 1-like [Synchiropus splendidus]|uniref:mast cell protease 1-like n=1 Tax=Synchiropus splendidus TaxID=270530 RepID=UPI00237D6E64|nr:mast cell protease 1-like [Synchiropus splendidus]XP_053733165.1 mast cell protease 1-like [Synchiropus splendidus]XP_053733166.1 mast cell protease 1-like [Synchiropus splendidus]